MRSIMVLGVSVVYMGVLPFFATLAHNGMAKARSDHEIITSVSGSSGQSVIYKTPFAG